MTIQTATYDDIPEILALYVSARAFMAASGNPNQWSGNYPGPEDIQTDMQGGWLYTVKEKSKIHGCFSLIGGEDPTYRVITQGAWRKDAPYGTLHRVVSDGSGGILQNAVQFASKKFCYLRADTHAQNFPMQKALKNAGFVYCGIITCHNGTERLAYDWIGE